MEHVKFQACIGSVMVNFREPEYGEPLNAMARSMLNQLTESAARRSSVLVIFLTYTPPKNEVHPELLRLLR